MHPPTRTTPCRLSGVEVFLTRMPINGARRGARLLIASPHAMHAAVLAGFAEGHSTSEGRILWRLDTYGGRRHLLYVVSPDQPDFTHLVEQAGWPTTETWESRPYAALLDSLCVEQVWHFRLTANPVRAGRRGDWQETKPLGHVTVTQQERWLLDRANRLGFRVPPVASGSSQTPDVAVVQRGVRRFGRDGATVTLATATYEGHLQVTDVAALRRALNHGVGRAKAYGCGMLTLARAGGVSR